MTRFIGVIVLLGILHPSRGPKNLGLWSRNMTYMVYAMTQTLSVLEMQVIDQPMLQPVWDIWVMFWSCEIPL